MKELEKLIKSLEEEIMIELKNFNFKRNSLAYEYLIDVIIDRSVTKDFSRYVYDIIGEKYNTKSENVLWSTNKLISLMYFNTDEGIIKKYFNTYKLDKPTTKAFIIGVARRINLKTKRIV